MYGYNQYERSCDVGDRGFESVVNMDGWWWELSVGLYCNEDGFICASRSGPWDVVCYDTDDDGILDDSDNCPNICNPQQLNADNDEEGDSCDATPGCGGCGQVACEISCDIDNDGISILIDNCPSNCNINQTDADNDNIGDVCDPDPGCGGCGLPACETEC